MVSVRPPGFIGARTVRWSLERGDCQTQTFAANYLFMEKGINSDLAHSNEQYHVQTEDWGRENPFIVTRVFLHGAVVRSVKTPYAELIPKSGLRDLEMLSQLVQQALRKQHDEILDQLVTGKLFGKRPL